jgi:hypothetical protein
MPKTSIHVCLEPVQHEALRLAARQHERSVSEEIRTAVDRYLRDLLRLREQREKRK